MTIENEAAVQEIFYTWLRIVARNDDVKKDDFSGASFSFSRIGSWEIKLGSCCAHKANSLAYNINRNQNKVNCGWDLAAHGWDQAVTWMRSSLGSERPSDCQCRSRTSPGFNPSILHTVESEGRQMKQCWMYCFKKFKTVRPFKQEEIYSSIKLMGLKNLKISRRESTKHVFFCTFCLESPAGVVEEEKSMELAPFVSPARQYWH